MTETKRHIEELKKAIPSLKERVVAVALLLALSLVMIASVSYAWVTMSVSPELGGVNTTVAANGALEIALSDFDGAEPNTSAVGDSFAAENQTFHNANVSWGNLVNLSTGYGIESLVLRPAALDLLSEVPLYGVQYSEDGRVEGSLSDFGYTTWYRENEDADWAFIVPQADSNNVYPAQFPDGKYYGVRAISSVAYKSDASAEMKRLLRLVDMQRESRDNYITMTEDTDNIQVITNLVQEYLDQNIDAAVDAVLGGTYNEPNFEMNGSTYVPALTNMLNYFYSNVILEAGEAMVYAANLQRTSGDEYTLDDLLAADRATLLENGVKLTALGYNEKTGTYSNPQYFKQLHDDVKTDLTTLQSALFWDANGKPKSTIMWFDLKPIVNNLIHIDSLTVEGKTINQIAGLGTGALSFVNGLPEHAEVVLYQGYLYDFEDLMGGKFMLMVIPIKAQKMGVLNYNGYGDIHTDVSRTKDSMFATDLNTVQKQLNAVDNRKMTAQDTYGMVLDLWIRTNGENSMLMLNGTPEIETYQQQLQMIPSGESEKRNVWVYEAYTGDVVELTEGVSQFETQEILVYKKDESKDSEGNYNTDGDYYNCTSNLLVCKIELQKNNDGTYTAVQTDTPITSTDVDPKQETLERVIGYHSANRIWKDDDTENNPPVLEPMMGEISTTQGSGSCYIFHADTPEASARALELLSKLRLVFLNDQGKELAQASLDVKHVYAENGKYTVPIAVNRSSYVVTDEDNNSTYAICPLFKNEPVRISVLVYLDGSQLTNEMVMSKDDIVGSLNLQFDSSADLRSLGDSALSLDVLAISADVSTDYFTYAGDPVSTKLTATVSGITAAKVEAYFQRQINATQGSRQETIALSDEDKDGTWEANATFTTPGVYVMSSLLVDGIEYDLPETITVTVDGFGVSSVSFDESAALSTGRSVSRDVSVTINSTIQPTSVEARFMTSDGHSVSASLRASSASASGVTWVGSATFTNSGTYTLQYLVMDGQYYELSDGSPDPNGLPTSRLQRSFTAYLGLTAEVTLERYNWVNGEIEKDSYGNNVILPLSYDFTQVENIYAFVQIFDDAGNLMTSLGNMDLYYYSEGSSLPENGFICPDMTWNGTYYVGTFKADKPGIFHFGRIDVGSQVISSAASAPTMQLRSLEPPAFVSHVTDSQILVADGEVFYQVEIDEARTAQRWVVFENLDSNQSFEVPLLPSGIEDVYQAAFPDLVPNADVFSSNGSWKVSKLLFTNVYVNGEFYNDINNKFVMDNFLPAEFTVVNYLTMNVEPIVLGATVADDGTVTKTGAFMQSYSLNGDTPLQLVVSAPGVGADVLEEVLQGVTLTLNHNYESSGTYGSYTTNTPLNAIVLNAQDSTVIYDTTNGTATLTYSGSVVRAGTYNCSAVATISNGVETVTFDSDGVNGFAGSNAISVYSKSPTVKVTGISPDENTEYRVYTVKKPEKTDVPALQGKYSSYTDYSAGVFLWTPLRTGDYDQEAAHIYAPEVTLTLTGISEEGFESAQMEFVTPNEDSLNSTFAFTLSNGQIQATSPIGKAVDGAESVIGVNKAPEGYPAGKMEQNKITITYNGISYTIVLENTITIDQQQSPTVLQFIGIPETYTEPKPKDIVGVGNTITVKLPELVWTAETAEPAGEATWGSYVAVETNPDYTKHTIREYSVSGWFSTTEYREVTYYNWTTFQSTCTTVTNYFIQDMAVTKWLINGVEYDADQTITINNVSGIITATAIVKATSEKVSDPNKESKEDTLKMTIYGYEEGRKDTLRKTTVPFLGTIWIKEGDTEAYEFEESSQVNTAPDLADISSANANTGAIGINTTTIEDDYSQFLN